MTFFEPLPPRRPRSPRPRQPEWIAPPRNELPVGVAAEVLVGRTADAAVSVGAIRVFSTGFELELSVLTRPSAGLDDVGLPGNPRSRTAPDDDLRFGLSCADGSRAEAERPRAGEAQDRTLTGRGGGGDGSAWHFRYWSWPLPPPGPIELHCRWRAAGIEESSATLDAGPILAAAARVEQLWPEEHEDAEGGGSWLRYGPGGGG